jgi:hypothetical protein
MSNSDDDEPPPLTIEESSDEDNQPTHPPVHSEKKLSPIDQKRKEAEEYRTKGNDYFKAGKFDEVTMIALRHMLLPSRCLQPVAHALLACA